MKASSLKLYKGFPQRNLKIAREIELKSHPSFITFYDYEVNIFLEEIYLLKLARDGCDVKQAINFYDFFFFFFN